MLHQIASKYDLNLSDTFFIGDSNVDVQAAKAANCMPILVLTGNGQRALEKHPELLNIPNFSNLAGAVDYVISRQRKN